MSLAVLGVSRDQIMGNSGHLTRIFFPHHFQTCRPPQTPPENLKNRFFWIFKIHRIQILKNSEIFEDYPKEKKSGPSENSSRISQPWGGAPGVRFCQIMTSNDMYKDKL